MEAWGREGMVGVKIRGLSDKDIFNHRSGDLNVNLIGFVKFIDGIGKNERVGVWTRGSAAGGTPEWEGIRVERGCRYEIEAYDKSIGGSFPYL